ncbi:MAG: ABC transporter permease [Clostridia bacterium]|nr:ABC transporter permease [Clostridia bacterium]
MSEFSKDSFSFVTEKEKEHNIFRKSLTYWQDAWRRLKKNKLAMIGLAGIFLVIGFGVLGPLFTNVSYSDQQNDFKNLGPRLEVYEIAEGLYVHVSGDYHMFVVDNEQGQLQVLEEIEKEESVLDRSFTDGKIMSPAEKKKLQQEAKNNVESNSKTYEYNGQEIVLDYSNLVVDEPVGDYEYKITYNGIDTTQVYGKMANKEFPLGTDGLGRDLLTRIMYGTRISLIVALVATIVNFVIGVLYGAISGFEGGTTDNIMMRIVDIINSVPLILIIILMMVLLGNQGLWTIILAIGLVYWVGMARLVRGQMLSLKEQEFILAARTLGVSKRKIIMRHLIPNAMGPIIVSMTMMIPSAIFTESFLSFIGLGVSAPQASLGTLANNALGGILTYPYQLFFPALTIALMMLAFNFLGDGLRDALDPRLRKG